MGEPPRAVHDPVLLEYTISGNNVELYVTSTDAAAEGAYIFQEVVLDDEYLKHGLGLQPGAVVIDIGAHIGIFGIRALTTVPSGDITYIGVEPCPTTFQALRFNLLGPDGKGAADSFFHQNERYAGPVPQAAASARASAAYPGNILLFNKAVSDHTGHQIITYYPHMPSNSTFNPAEKQQLQAAVTPAHYFKESQQLSVSVTTLDQLLQEAGMTGCCINLLKIDVEGHEVEVLRGTSDTTWTRIQQLVVEVHDVGREGADSLAGANTAFMSSSTEPYHNTQQPPTALQHSLMPLTQQPALPDGPCCLAAPHTDELEQLGLHETSVCTSRTSGTNPITVNRGSIELKGMLRPQDGGRVMQVVRLLAVRGFRVVVDCPMGLPTNFTVYARKI